jgi:NAD(P)-dependent dehydrogenase (short-subunit alcohol dehydrogenase family)
LSESKLIVITGATKGLGRALTEGFIFLGHRVIGCGRSEELITNLNDKYNPGNDFQVIDVSNARAVKSWAENILSRFGIPSILINNAAIINKNAPLWEVSSQEFSDVIDINIKGTANTIRAFVPEMIKKRSGIIVNFSSTWGRTTSPEVTPYCTTKWAIEGLTKAFSQELPAGMVTVSLNPGVIDTDMLRSCLPGMATSCQSPQQWAKKATQMISNLKSSDNGKSLSV